MSISEEGSSPRNAFSLGKSHSKLGVAPVLSWGDVQMDRDESLAYLAGYWGIGRVPAKAKFYLAAQLADREVAAILIRAISVRGDLECTFDWTVNGSVRGQGLARYREIAEAEVKGVRDADFLILLAPGGRGAHVELGIAIAREIPVLILYRTLDDMDKPYPSVFHYLPQISRMPWGGNETNWMKSFREWIGKQKEGRTA